MRIAYGGVSAKPHGPVVCGYETILRAPRVAKGAFPNFAFNGGPVIATPAVHTTFWGASWQTPAAKPVMDRLNQFLIDVMNSEFMNVLSQYGAGSGKGSGTFAGTSVVADVASQLTNAGVDAALQKAIDAGTVPEPPANNTSLIAIVFLDESIEIDDTSQGLVMCEPSGDTAFGYHDFFTTTTGNSCVYAVIPALDDKCMANTCPAGTTGCSLDPNLTQEQRRTQVTSHEFAEMVTDPQLNAWYDPQNGENGDICNGESETITVGPNTWTVQRTYSKADDEQTNGKTYCRATAPSPLKLP